MADLYPVRPVLLHWLRDYPVTFSISISFIVLVIHWTSNRYVHSASSFASKVVEPHMITSWLPWIGSGLEYMFHPLSFFKTHSNRHGSLFKFKLFGQTFVAISSPTAVSNLFRDHSGSFDTINWQSIHHLIGTNTSEDRARYIYSALIQKAVPPVHRGLMPSRLPTISSRWTKELLKALIQIDLTSRRLSLSDFVHRTLYNTNSIALFGADFPLHTFENFMIFDEGAALQVRQLGMFARAARAARESLFASWTRHLIENWKSEKDGHLLGATDMISDVYRGLKQTDLSQDEVHRVMFGIIWAIHANIMELTTWVMCHIITDKDVYARICHEIRSFVDQQFPQIDSIAQADPTRLLDDDAFRFLNSVVQEVMRTTCAFGPVKVATRDAVVMDEGGKEILIRQGETVMVNLPGMHHSPSLQEEPEVFKADRFINGASYRSYIFGGGKHICAGRNFANFAVRQFIVLTLAKYDIRVEHDAVNGSGSLPEQDGTMGLKLILFARRRNDLSITLHPIAK